MASITMTTSIVNSLVIIFLLQLMVAAVSWGYTSCQYPCKDCVPGQPSQCLSCQPYYYQVLIPQLAPEPADEPASQSDNGNGTTAAPFQTTAAPVIVQCLSQCPVGFYGNATYGNCSECSVSGCALCDEVSCLVCKEGLELESHSSKCVDAKKDHVLIVLIVLVVIFGVALSVTWIVFCVRRKSLFSSTPKSLVKPPDMVQIAKAENEEDRYSGEPSKETPEDPVYDMVEGSPESGQPIAGPRSSVVRVEPQEDDIYDDVDTDDNNMGILPQVQITAPQAAFSEQQKEKKQVTPAIIKAIQVRQAVKNQAEKEKLSKKRVMTLPENANRESTTDVESPFYQNIQLGQPAEGTTENPELYENMEFSDTNEAIRPRRQ